MSEPIKITDSGNGYVSSGGRPSEPVQIEFKDGLHTVQAAIVAHLGGTEQLKLNAGKFKGNTYQEFIVGFWKLVERDTLNKAGAAFLSGQLGGFGF